MLEASLNFQESLRSHGLGKRAVLLLHFINEGGQRVWSDVSPTDTMLGSLETTLADGRYPADGSRTAGVLSQVVLERGARLLDSGEVKESLQPHQGRLLTNLGYREALSHQIVLSNAKDGPGVHPMSRLQSQENILSAQCELHCTFPGLLSSEAQLLSGTIVQAYRLSRERLTLELIGV